MTEIEKPRLADEMEKMEYEPLLPVEKKLIIWSISLAISQPAKKRVNKYFPYQCIRNSPQKRLIM